MSFKAALSFFASLAITALLSVGSARAEPVKLVGFGDSLMAGYQLPAADAFPVKLEKALRENGYEVEIANAGVSGDTSSGGLARLDWSIPEGTQGVILELGANDALRGIPPEETEKNLDAMLTRLKERGIAVLLAGMLAPPNMGPEYGERFNGIYQRMAEKHGVALYPFFLDGVVTKANLQLEDGMHPNSEGVDVMVATILPAAEAFIKSIPAKE
ncbi:MULTISPECIES: arylesterase [unclassified Shinella]|uniref:arylesterase n=1 Tax=unclassified Shinella TaxID=2643062 RepID=UPI00234E4682|nr:MULTISPECIES: arylesterase [unclassified Shinella]MCO5154938.1 arylesterase [Shinella sp.]MDC7263850.1 arylesterase [Shinella sp. HY16]MDC7270746.1 arylesterase [Shinella sp. YZ44]